MVATALRTLFVPSAAASLLHLPIRRIESEGSTRFCRSCALCLLLASQHMTVVAGISGAVAQYGPAEGESVAPMTGVPIRLHLEGDSEMVAGDHEKCHNGAIIGPKAVSQKPSTSSSPSPASWQRSNQSDS